MSQSTRQPAEPFVPGVQHDIFISYKHLDGMEQADPWMDTLYRCLDKQLLQRLGKVSMFRDNLFIKAGDQWQEKLVSTVDGAPAFLAVLSAPYFSSDVCVAEFNAFLDRLKSSEQDPPARKLFPIMRLPTEHEALQELRAVPLHFYDSPSENKPAREFPPDRAEHPESRFYEAVLELADDMERYLRVRSGDIKKQLMPVYMSTCDFFYDDPRRVEVARDIKSFKDLLLLPDQPYVWSSAAHAGLLARHLDAARLSLFIVPHEAKPLAVERSSLQLAQAITSTQRQGTPKPMVWVPPGKPGGEQAEALIHSLRNELACHIELFDGCDIEEFKTNVEQVLEPLRQDWAAAHGAAPSAAPASAPVPLPLLVGKPAGDVTPPRMVASAGSGKVGVVVAKDDVAASGPLMSRLAEGFQRSARRVVVSDAEPLSDMAEKLASVDALIVVWGGSDEDWVQDTLDAPVCRALRTRGALATYLAGPIDDQKKTFSQLQVTPLREDALDADLGGFLAKLRPAS
jgi:hypothetical protein